MPQYDTASPDTTPAARTTTIVGYLRAHHDSFAARPFGDVDSLVLSTLAYLRLDQYPYADTAAQTPVPLCDILRFSPLESLVATGWIASSKDLEPFVDALLRNRRFGDLCVSLCRTEDSIEHEKQFSACLFTMEAANASPVHYVAFRGTDGTFSGWKEDFNLSYQDVLPSHRAAAAYLSGAISSLGPDAHVLVGGHSKGGNLAEFAACTVDDSQFCRIDAVFNHDGPSFLNPPSPRFDSRAYRQRLRKSVPESAMLGLILETRNDFLIVDSNAVGFGQHEPFTWLVEDTSFATKPQLSETAQFFNKTLDRWIKSVDIEQRKVFVDTIYELIANNGANTKAEFLNNLAQNLSAIIQGGAAMDEGTRGVLLSTFAHLGGATTFTLRESLQGFIGQIVDAAQQTVDLASQMVVDEALMSTEAAQQAAQRLAKERR